MAEGKFVKAYCSKTNKYYGLEVRMYGGTWKVVNMDELSEDKARLVATEVTQPTFETNVNLLPCSVCDTRVVGSCNCLKSRTACSASMPYNFDCIYCSEMKIDYSKPKLPDVAEHVGEWIEIQGKKVRVITFSNVEWAKFDKVAFHPPGRPRYSEPLEHVIASEENIEFHGYNISQMDEGVRYTIDKSDDFEIECHIDTSHISPHPGGHLYISFGILTAQITENGGNFFLDGKQVATVGSVFDMKLSLTECGKYEIFIDGQKKAEQVKAVTEDTTIVFGFAHGNHDCYMLSHAYINGIKMSQGRAIPKQ